MSGVRRIIVGVSGTPGSLQALRHAAELARVHSAPLVPVHVWTPPGGDLADRSHPSPYLRQIWRDAAWQRLWEAIDLAFGGVPEDVCLESDVVRGDPGDVLVGVACHPDDVLVIGAGRRETRCSKKTKAASTTTPAAVVASAVTSPQPFWPALMTP